MHLQEPSTSFCGILNELRSKHKRFNEINSALVKFMFVCLPELQSAGMHD